MTSPECGVGSRRRPLLGVRPEIDVRRALGFLSVDDEGEIAELLDDFLRDLSTHGRQQIEEWVRAELQPAPDAEIDQGSTEVEAEDITLAPRSAA